MGVIGDRSNGPFSVYMPYKDFDRIQLSDGDKVLFNDDMHAQVYDVQVMGSYRGPSYFTVRKETRLHDLLNHIPIDPNMADYGSIYIMRKSVAARQKEMLEDSLNRLERSVFTAPASSDGEASIRTKEAELVMRFVEKARKIKPLVRATRRPGADGDRTVASGAGTARVRRCGRPHGLAAGRQTHWPHVPVQPCRRRRHWGRRRRVLLAAAAPASAATSRELTRVPACTAPGSLRAGAASALLARGCIYQLIQARDFVGYT